ncbi:MAG TPA: hypothetical protein VEZ26_02110 [Sphingomonadaceae bacterium]|nr:hypothetical protein [Sphingomonadaceae bacterium]
MNRLRSLLNSGEQDRLHANKERVWLDLSQFEIDARDLRLHLHGTASLGAQPQFLEGLDISDAEEFEDWLREQRVMLQTRLEKLLATPAETEPIALPEPATLAKTPHYDLPLHPSIAVLPFKYPAMGENIAALAEGVADEICNSLARYSTLFVVAASPASRDDEDFTALSETLGVRYLLRGRVHIQGSLARVSVRLIDGLQGRQFWADQFDGETGNLFELLDRIATAIAPLIDATIERNERRKALARPINSASTHDLFWRANALFRQWTQPAMQEAITLAERVLEIEPDNSWAAALAAFCHAWAFTSSWSEDPSVDLQAANLYYEKALRAGGNDPFVLGYAAGTLVCIAGNMDVADQLIERALGVHPHMSSTLFWGGWVDIANGRMERAIERFQLALRFNPHSAVRPHSLTGIAIGLLSLGRAEEGLTLLNEAVQYLPNNPATLAALALGHYVLGRPELARIYARRLLDTGGAERALAIAGTGKYNALLMELMGPAN